MEKWQEVNKRLMKIRDREDGRASIDMSLDTCADLLAEIYTGLFDLSLKATPLMTSIINDIQYRLRSPESRKRFDAYAQAEVEKLAASALGRKGGKARAGRPAAVAASRENGKKPAKPGSNPRGWPKGKPRKDKPA